MTDNGRGVLRMAVMRLEKEQDDYLMEYVRDLKEILEQGDYDYAKLKVIKREILAHIIPLDRIFTSQGRRDEVDTLLCDISDYLQKQIRESKKGEDLILIEYMQPLEEYPMAVKKAILDD